MVDAGEFELAESAIRNGLAESASTQNQRQALSYERERMRRIRIDFPYRREQIKQQVRQQIPDMRDAEFDAWDRAGLFEHQVIDGDKVYFERAASNLFRVSPSALARRDAALGPLRAGPLETLHPHHAEVIREALKRGSSNVAPRRVRIDYSIVVKADAVPAGKTIRAWLPYPRAIPGQQADIRTVSSTPHAHRIAPESALQRTIHLEQPARGGTPTRFAVSYEVTVFAQHHVIDPDKVVPAPSTPELRAQLGERLPHIVFTPELRKFSREVVGDEMNPYRIARRLFAAVDRIPWAGAREYSTIHNISDYALKAGHADCGQQTLLLMTLLRLNGIPARWQSGWVFSDGDYDTMHDWGWLYLAPYGWVPMDVTFGRLPGEQADAQWFYLGGLDAYRVAFNDDYGREFVPPKKHFRSETVDLQRGEVEWDGGNLYFDQWDYEFRWAVLSDRPVLPLKR
ncbi:MAG: transglutaminase-like domain-containing protein [Lysobacterales bacterium]